MGQQKKKDADTRMKIYESARKVFRAKGYAGARMQEIADEAGINKALLHYYFESKEKLFETIFFETVQSFLGNAAMTLNNPSTSWKEKIYEVAGKYTDFLKANPEIPLFVISELTRKNDSFFTQLPIPKMLEESFFIYQLQEAQQKGEIAPVAPLQIIVSMISGLVFPFVARPMVQLIGGLDEKKYSRFLEN
jgi:AcrR family transcriptional regulator